MPTEMPAPSAGLTGGQVGFLILLLAAVIYHSRAILIPAIAWLILALISIYVLPLLGMELPFGAASGPADIGTAVLTTGAIAFACLYYRRTRP